MPGHCPVANGRRGRIWSLLRAASSSSSPNATVGTCSGSSTSHGSRSSKGGVESDRPHPFARLGQEPVATINREQLKTRLEDGEPIKLVMALDRWVFDAKHIPGSLHFDDPDDLYSSLQKDDEIVVYCSNVDCLSIVALYRALVERGYRNVRRYSGGLLDWEDGRCFQCSAGKSLKVSSASWSSTNLVTALGHLAPNSSANAPIARVAACLLSALVISRMARLAAGCTDFGSASSTLAVLCTESRCGRVSGKTSL
jgi:rhodanese-related sulfurtransferase